MNKLAEHEKQSKQVIYARHTCNDGSVYEGYWLKGKFNGRGIYVTSVYKYIGDWVLGCPTGVGTLYMNNGDVYQGQYSNGLRHGVGTQWYSDSSKYHGEWHYNKRHGHGFYYDSSTGDHKQCSESDEKRQNTTRLKLANVITRWLSCHFHDFDEELLKKTTEGVNVVFKEIPIHDKIMQTLIEQKNKKRRSEEMEYVFSTPPPTSVYPKSSNFEDFNSDEVARQLCLYEQSILRSIHPKELLYQNRPDSKEKAPNVSRYYDFFTQFVNWVCTQIISTEKLKERAKVIKKFISIMIYCYQHSNFNTLFEIALALNHVSTRRLESTWAIVEKDKKLIQEYRTLSKLISPTNNSEVYRTALAKASTPCLPYLGRQLSDLLFIAQGNPDYLDVSNGTKDIINFDKMRKIAAVVSQVIFYQQQPYNFHKVESIYNYFSGGLQYLSEKELIVVSRKMEPSSPKNNTKISSPNPNSNFKKTTL